MRTNPKVRAEDASLVAKLADLLERAGPQFIATARRKVAATEVAAAVALKARLDVLNQRAAARRAARQAKPRRRAAAAQG